MRFVPLQISFYMRTPLLMGFPWIHFDALIAHVLLRREMGEDYYVLPSKHAEKEVEEILRKHMPLKRSVFQGYEIWHGSVSFFEEEILGGATIYKRFDSRHICFSKTKKKKVDLSRGYFKMYAMRFPMIVTRRVIFYACGDKEEIEELVSNIPCLGKKRVVGWGAIRKVEIEEIEEDRSIVSRDGTVMRPIPILAFTQITIDKKVHVGKVAYRPPYWWKKNVEMCVLPRSKLKKWKLEEKSA